MAFQQAQPRPQAVQRPAPAVVTVSAPQDLLSLSQSPEEWILFSPQTVDDQTLASHTPQTTNISHHSDLGSLESGLIYHHALSSNKEDQTHENKDTELDSLDDNLYAFDQPLRLHLDQSGTVLPTHDGLGAFPPTLESETNRQVQEQIWRHEHRNPDKPFGRHLSKAKASDAVQTTQDERILRVEQWRLSQSQAILEEVERVARRQRRYASHLKRHKHEHSAKRSHDSTSETEDRPQSKWLSSSSFWHRITRRVVHDLLGLDHATLAILFGHDYVNVPGQSGAGTTIGRSTSTPDLPSWEEKLVARVARELGMLVQQIAEPASAFTTYTSAGNLHTSPHAQHKDCTSRSYATRTRKLTFKPTLHNTSRDTRLSGIREEPLEDSDAAQAAEYWERDPSMGMIFGYLVNRFSGNTPPEPSQYSAHPPVTSCDEVLPSEWATTGNVDESTRTSSAARANMIGQNHPLVSQSTQRHREALLRSHLQRHQQNVRLQQQRQQQQDILSHALAHRRVAGSSCGSQSTNKRSKRSSATGHSRNYWDFPSGVADESEISASLVSSVGHSPGAWGEV